MSNKKITEESSRKISFWSFVFAIAVVVIHCSWTAESEVGRLSIALFRDTLARMAVPFFFVCSGYFLARHFGEDNWWRHEVGKRIVSLGLPYLGWTLALALVLLIESHEVMGIGGLGLNPCKMPALAPLWYVRCLMVFVVLSPIFKWGLERLGVWSLVFAYLLMSAFAAILGRIGLTDESGLGGLLCYGFSLEGLFYFLAGILIQRKNVSAISNRLAVAAIAFGCVLMALRLYLLHANISIMVDLRCLITPLLLAGLWRLVDVPTLPRVLSGCAFPIFVMHGVVIAIFRNSGGSYHVCNPWLELAVGVIMPIAFANVIRRFLPQTRCVLFGGR